ncbi:MAG TPA: hypothetical protein VMW56_17210 [Candidatus Margulisiibacteriota bacterium]|nr:hypothetical protein [Candidatus Margulisiibacteriota bacterium]
MDTKHTKGKGPHLYYWHGTLPPALLLLLVAPLLFVFLSFAAMLLAGGTLAALFLPLFLRGRLRRPADDNDAITLDRDQYSHVERDTKQLPPR